MLGEFVGQESERQARAEDRHVEVFQNIRQRADMVFVRVSEYDRFEFVSSLEEIAYVGNDQIDAQKIGARKHEAAIDSDGSVAVFDQHHVEAELAQTTERYDLH